MKVLLIPAAMLSLTLADMAAAATTSQRSAALPAKPRETTPPQQKPARPEPKPAQRETKSALQTAAAQPEKKPATQTAKSRDSQPAVQGKTAKPEKTKTAKSRDSQQSAPVARTRSRGDRVVIGDDFRRDDAINFVSRRADSGARTDEVVSERTKDDVQDEASYVSPAPPAPMIVIGGIAYDFSPDNFLGAGARRDLEADAQLPAESAVTASGDVTTDDAGTAAAEAETKAESPAPPPVADDGLSSADE